MKMAPSFAQVLWWYSVALAVSPLPLNCNALGGETKISAERGAKLPSYEVNVTVPSQRGYQHAEYGLIEGVKLIESMKGASSCKTKATQQLLSSCSVLEGTQPSGIMNAEELDKVKSQYAARLAVCELQEAENPPKLPRCSSLGISELVPPIDRDHLASCLRELQNDMVFWGSYTNNLQNVGYMCQVARAEIEKEELVEQRRASLQTTLLVTRVLSEFQQSVATHNAELLTNSQQLRDLHRQNVEELTTARKDTSTTLHQLREDFGAQLQNVADKAEAVIETVAASASGKNQEVAAYVQNVEHSLERIWQMMAEGNAEVAARQLRDSEDSHHMVLVTQHALERVVMDEVGRLSNGLSSLSNELLLAGNQVSSIRQGHVSLADSLNQSVAKSSQLADVLDKLNVPVLEMFAKAASLTNFVFSDGFLVLLGFFSPLAVITFCAAFVQFSLMFWLLRLSLLLASSYVILWVYTFWDSSPVLRSIGHGALQATTISLVLVMVCCFVYLSFATTRGIYCRLHQPRRVPVESHDYDNDDENDNVHNYNDHNEFDLDYIDDYDGEYDDNDMDDEDQEVSRLKRARMKSIENASKARVGRASTAPPC